MPALEFKPPTRAKHTADEEAALAARAQAGDTRAAEELYEAVALWVVKISRKVAAQSSWDVEEAVATANAVFFTEVLPRFDPQRGRLTSLIGLMLPQRLRRARRTDRLIRTPDHWDQTEENRRRRPKSTSLAHTPRDDGATLGDLLPGDGPNPLRGAIRAEETAVALKAVSQLHPTYREVVQRCVIGNETLEQAGEAIGVTRERVRQLTIQAMASLRRRYDDLVERPRVGVRACRFQPQQARNPTRQPVDDLIAMLDRITPENLSERISELDLEFDKQKQAYRAKRKKLAALANLVGVKPPQAERRAAKPSVNGRDHGSSAGELQPPREGTIARAAYDHLEANGPAKARAIADAIGRPVGSVATALSGSWCFSSQGGGLWALAEGAEE